MAAIAPLATGADGPLLRSAALCVASHRNLRLNSQNNTADEYIANLEEKCQANFIKLSVDSAAREYTVSIPARGHERTFAFS